MEDTVTAQRTHRSLEEWAALQRERAQKPEPEPKGWYGSVKVNVYGVPWQAPSVEELKAEGYEVIIHHAHKYRRAPQETIRLLAYPWFKDMKHRDPRGGRTYVTLLHKDGMWARGQVKCWVGDIYSKRIGYVLAVNRALDQLNGK